MSDAQGPNMSRAWNLEFGNKLLGIIREEREKAMDYEFTVEFASGKGEPYVVDKGTLDNEIMYLNQEKNALHKEGEDYIVGYSYKAVDEQ